jgi:hypothetical protein
LYESCYVNFISAVPTELLEEMARATFLSDTSKAIVKVHDQYADYVALEENLFTLNQPNSYFNFNNPLIQDLEAQRNISQVVNSLFRCVVLFSPLFQLTVHFIVLLIYIHSLVS